MIYEDMLPWVLPDVPGCPDTLAVHHLRDAARDFCLRTLAWRVTLPAITSVVGVSTYDLALPVDAEMVKLLRAWRGTDEWAVADADDPAEPGDEHIRLLWDRASVQINPVPSIAGQAHRVEVALQPTLSSAGLVDEIARFHARDIAAGACAELLRMQAMPWAKPELAMGKAEAFERHVSRTALRVSKSLGRTRGRVPLLTY